MSQPTVSISAMTPPANAQHFVMHADLSASIGELCQFLQGKFVDILQKVASTLPTPQPFMTAPFDPPQPSSSLPTQIGEYQSDITFPWLSGDLINKIHQDTLSVYNLPKLANPSWPGATAQEEPALVVIEGFSVIKGQSTSTSNHQFIKAVPSFSMFGQLWVIYLSLQSSSSNDRDLPVSLGRFYQHVADLSEVFPWDRVAGYVIAVCTSRLGRANASKWAWFNTELHASHFQGVPARSNTASSTKRLATRHDKPQRDQSRGIAAGGSGFTIPLSDSSSSLLFKATTPMSRPAPSSSSSNPVHVPPADIALTQLAPLQTLRPPARPNTTLAVPLYPTGGIPARHGTMQAAVDRWCQALLHYPDGSFEPAHGPQCLTFGGCSSLWIFNLFAKALHWVLQSTTTDPIDHYLDDFFGAVPATSDLGQPLHALALACSALGLQLAPLKTFWAATKLEILGIQIDTIQQSVGITPERCLHILDTTNMLLARRSARLLDWQHIAGLLQFVS
ncbi:hypothetical protein NDA13_006596 [Ustilago tritici]|nr:hypothetical protein NDA13_006596 [Ustilago tritici]